MDDSMPNADNPRLGIGETLEQAIGGRQYVVRDFKGSSFNVDRHYLPVITFFDLRSHLCLIEGIAALGKLFFAISGLSNCHGVDLAATCTLLF
jgi:hypothetical protein